MTDLQGPYMQEGYPDANGVMVWQEPYVAPLDTLKNLKQRWRDAGTYEAHEIVEIENGIEINSSLTDVWPGHRTRLVWPS